MESTQVALPFKFEIEFIILNTQSRKIDIRGLMTELKLTQSIYENTMSAEMKILDANDRLSDRGEFIIKGGESLSVKFKAQNDKKYFAKIFYVDKVTNVKKESNHGKTYILTLVTSEEIFNNKVKISKAYTNKKISNIVNDILTNNLNIESPKIEESLNKISYIAPYIAPFKLINNITTYALSKVDESATFCCFETSTDTRFVSLASLISKKSKSTYTYGPSSKKNIISNPEQANLLIQELNFNKKVDISNNIISGMSKSKLLQHNILLKQYGGKQINSTEPIKFDYDQYFNNTKHLDKTKLNNPKNFSDYDSMYKYFHRDVAKSDNFKKPPKLEYYDNQSNSWLQKRYAIHAQLDNIVCDITIPGNCDLVCGDVIDLLVQLDKPIEPGENLPINKKYSGRYLITTLQHVLNTEKLTTYATCIKDSTNG